MATMTPTEIAEKLQAQFGDKILETDLEAADPFCLVDPAAMEDIAVHCRDELGFEYLRCLSGVDYTATASVGDTVKAERFERSLEQFNR